MQNTRFALADLKADLTVGWAYVDQCLAELTAGVLTTEGASIAKLWVTEMQGRLVDRRLQFFGGYGFMREYEICRLYADARLQRIYGGSSEIIEAVREPDWHGDRGIVREVPGLAERNRTRRREVGRQIAFPVQRPCHTRSASGDR
jgi:hypothetical protein